MNALLAIARKDALLLWRDKAALFWILGLPLLFASFFGTIFSGGGGGGSRGSLTLQVIDEVDHAGSKQFVARLEHQLGPDEFGRHSRTGERRSHHEAVDIARAALRSFLDREGLPP